MALAHGWKRKSRKRSEMTKRNKKKEKVKFWEAARDRNLDAW